MIFSADNSKNKEMNRLFLYILQLIAISATFVSCSSSADALDGKANSSDSVIISVRLSREAQGRAMGNPSASDESGRIDERLSTLSFFVFNNTGALVTLYNSQFKEGNVYTFPASADASEMLIVANVPEDELRQVSKKSDLVDKAVVSLSANHYSAIPMMGTTPISITDEVPFYTGTVSLKRLLARICVTNIAAVLPEGDTFTPTEIFVCRANEKHAIMNLHVANIWEGLSYSDIIESDEDGVSIKGATGETAVEGSLSFLSSGYGDNITLPREDSPDTWQYFYVFPHDDLNATRLVLKGVYSEALTQSTSVVYYPIIINHVYNTITVGENEYSDASEYAADSRLDANKNYELDLTIGGPGAEKPSGEVPRGAQTFINFTVGNYAMASQVTEIELDREDKNLEFNITITISSYKEAKQNTTL
jgi:hypothetical protein